MSRSSASRARATDRMEPEVVPAERPLRGSVTVPGDKSISHRAAIVAALARGRSVIRSFSPAGDCAATLRVLASLGVGIGRTGPDVAIEGGALRSVDDPLDCVRSGTTMRLLAGVLAGEPGEWTMTGDEQLLRRPMGRVAEPLRLMGAGVDLASGDRAPMRIRGGRLRGIRYRPPVASAQVKSAVLLAGLAAEGETTVVEGTLTRDHTERLLQWLGLAVVSPASDGPPVASVRAGRPRPFELAVPGDPSSAAAVLVAAAMVPGSDVTVRDVGLNPTRTSFLSLLRRMGADVRVVVAPSAGPEPWGDVSIRGGPLRAADVSAEGVPGLIDELPLLAVLATRAAGATRVTGAKELRVKESDRIAGVTAGLQALGADATELDDGFVVDGPAALRGGGACDAEGDHRLAMAFAVAALAADGPVRIDGLDTVADSFPGFLEVLEELR